MGPADSAIQRAQTLVAQGHTDQGRALVDSVLTTTPPTSAAYASALYARASLAINADSAEDDYRRITVEYATSPRASDALLRLAQLELARGDRVQAADHLARLTREQLSGQSGITYARTELQVGLAYLTCRISCTRAPRWLGHGRPRPRRMSNFATGSTTTSSGARARHPCRPASRQRVRRLARRQRRAHQ